jgi:protein-S-isoprenylcysteine O-methyltransferase Ste14
VLQPELIAERLGPKKGAKDWDLVVLGVLAVANLARLIVAGLDRRYAWTPPGAFPLPVMIAAAVLAAAGYAVFVWATASNAFFSQQVRLQEERGQRVATGGPYRFVRHPGYAGALLFEVFAPAALGSWWAFIPGLVGTVVLLARTALEDRTLQAELPGYAEYSAQTPYRLVPGIW